MLEFIEAMPLPDFVVFATVTLAFLAILSRLDRIAARNDRRLSEIDRNAAAELYRRAANEKDRAAELIRIGHVELQEVIALYQSREASRVTPWESLGIVARNMG